MIKVSKKKIRSQYTGILYNKVSEMWVPVINYLGIQIKLPEEKEEIDAARSYDIASLILFKLFGSRNFSDEVYTMRELINGKKRLIEILKSNGKKIGRKHIDKVFTTGRETYWPYLKQKNYVYFQKFIHDSLYDLRVIIIGNKYFGYFKMKSTI